MMFLCSHCKTEQPVSAIEYKDLKCCLCPNCQEICCEDYCVVLGNGRWNRLMIDMLIDEIDEASARAQDQYQRYQSTKAAYEKAKRAYEEAEKGREAAYERQNQVYADAQKVFNEAYARTKREYGIA